MKVRVFVIVLFCALACAQVSHAGVWANFWSAVGKTVEDYNNDMLATGDAVNASMKDGKIMEAFTSYEKNINVVGDHALANSKAVYTALKDIVLWLPRQIKKIWDKFVEILQKIRDALAALNQPGGGIIPPDQGGGGDGAASAKASSTYAPSAPTRSAGKSWMDAFDFKPVGGESGTSTGSNHAVSGPGKFKGLGDGWVELFENCPNLEQKLTTFSRYRGHCQTMSLWMNGQDRKTFEALEPKFTKVTSECDLLEENLFDEISSDIESGGDKLGSFLSFVEKLDGSERKVIFGSLAGKLLRRMKQLARSGSVEAGKSIDKLQKLFNG